MGFSVSRGNERVPLNWIEPGRQYPINSSRALGRHRDGIYERRPTVLRAASGKSWPSSESPAGLRADSVRQWYADRTALRRRIADLRIDSRGRRPRRVLRPFDRTQDLVRNKLLRIAASTDVAARTRLQNINKPPPQPSSSCWHCCCC
ncbi:hypothetical protein GWI33_003576 [Rhynchophorus ferrugineus]|uniref:Uncharacterized protein n=1 Tax=Rhynchophorus ferrugineus TaxID=354439 RepID=A0A834HKU5_RHYFE|nr:hypothetical protein GWI33_003576 [Rhynchophorus ferrugineus]